MNKNERSEAAKALGRIGGLSTARHWSGQGAHMARIAKLGGNGKARAWREANGVEGEGAQGARPKGAR